MLTTLHLDLLIILQLAFDFLCFVFQFAPSFTSCFRNTVTALPVWFGVQNTLCTLAPCRGCECLPSNIFYISLSIAFLRNALIMSFLPKTIQWFHIVTDYLTICLRPFKLQLQISMLDLSPSSFLSLNSHDRKWTSPSSWNVFYAFPLSCPGSRFRHMPDFPYFQFST